MKIKITFIILLSLFAFSSTAQPLVDKYNLKHTGQQYFSGGTYLLDTCLYFKRSSSSDSVKLTLRNDSLILSPLVNTNFGGKAFGSNAEIQLNYNNKFYSSQWFKYDTVNSAFTVGFPGCGCTELTIDHAGQSYGFGDLGSTNNGGQFFIDDNANLAQIYLNNYPVLSLNNTAHLYDIGEIGGLNNNSKISIDDDHKLISVKSDSLKLTYLSGSGIRPLLTSNTGKIYSSSTLDTAYTNAVSRITAGSNITVTPIGKGYSIASSGGSTDNITWKIPVKVMTGVNVSSLSGIPSSPMDGVTLADLDRVLLTGQNTGSQNGVWVIHDHAAWTRATDYDASSEIVGSVVPVLAGGTNFGSTFWYCTNNSTITVGSTAITYSSVINGSGIYPATLGLLSANSPATYNNTSKVIGVDTTVLSTRDYAENISKPYGSSGQIQYNYGGALHSNPYFVYDTIYKLFNVSYNGNSALYLSQGANDYLIGDVDGVNNYNVLDVNDAINQVNISQGGNRFLTIDRSNWLYGLGDIDDVNGKTKLLVDDDNNRAKISTGGNKYFQIGMDTQEMGDLDAVGNANKISVQNYDNQILLQADSVKIPRLGNGNSIQDLQINESGRIQPSNHPTIIWEVYQSASDPMQRTKIIRDDLAGSYYVTDSIVDGTGFYFFRWNNAIIDSFPNMVITVCNQIQRSPSLDTQVALSYDRNASGSNDMHFYVESTGDIYYDDSQVYWIVKIELY